MCIRDSLIADLIGRIGARIGLERITRHHPANSYIPEKSHQTLAAAWSEPAQNWTKPRLKRPVVLWRPEPLNGFQKMQRPTPFRWRGRSMTATACHGPERIAPEWWQDRPGTRLRDYYKVEVTDGRRFWLYRQGVMGDGRGADPRWFLHGLFA